MFFFFFFNATATTEIYTVSLHDALPISKKTYEFALRCATSGDYGLVVCDEINNAAYDGRSEEHTSELQSLTNLVCRLLLEKKKKKKKKQNKKKKKTIRYNI